ncbi:MAG: MFS transporter [Clostridia bacterium]|nr:MFS transporter [Clostridia bacterium]
MKLSKIRKDYKWVILAVCFLMEFICLGFCSSNPGLYTKAVTEALDIKRSLFSLTTSLRFIVQTITALYFGTLVGRFGVKKMVGVGLTSLTASVLIRALATQAYHLFISSALWGVGIVFSGSTIAGTIVRRWFKEDVGKYTGIVMSANGIGGAIAAQIITPIINNGEVFGYRKAYFLSAAITLLISIVILIFLKEHPVGASTEPYKKSVKKARGTMWNGIQYNTLKRKPYFYATIAMVFLTGISLQCIGTISVVYLTDLQLPSQYIATTVTVSSLFLTVTKMIVGIVYDKKGLRFTLIMSLTCACFAFVLKGLLTNSTLGMVMAMIASILTTFATPIETVMIPLMTNDLFGSASYIKALGVLISANSLGLCLGTPLADIYFDRFGTYRPCFWFFTVLILLVLVGYQFIISAAYKDKKAILDKENNKQCEITC